MGAELVWSGSSLTRWVIPVIGLIAVWLCYDSLILLGHDWFARGEYSHGMLIPLLSCGMLYRIRAEFLSSSKRPVGSTVHSSFARASVGNWIGGAVCIVAFMLAFVGRFSTIHALTQYAFVMLVIGAFYLFFGGASWRKTLPPLLLLLFMVPLPHFLHQLMSAQLQLWSSELGVALIKLFGISVYLEGNVIDLGAWQLQVLEACDGLRYLFPLMTLGCIAGYLYRGPLHERLLLFLITLPLTVVMNSLRIATIGVMVDAAGPSMAEGLLHDAQGWIMFVFCVAVLLIVARFLARCRSDRRDLGDLFGLDFWLAPESEPSTRSELPRTRLFPVSGVLLVGIGVLTALNLLDGQRDVELPERRDFLAFPLQIGDWHGKRVPLEQMYLEELRLTDYLQANYRHSSGQWGNVYVAYYDDQVSGRSVHSPRTCLPGGGWEMQAFSTVELPDDTGELVPVNRVVIGKGIRRQLVYYWFEQRGEKVASELLVKYLLLKDSLLEARTDGALVRLITPIPIGGDPRNGERTDVLLTDLFRQVSGHLSDYIPG